MRYVAPFANDVVPRPLEASAMTRTVVPFDVTNWTVMSPLVAFAGFEVAVREHLAPYKTPRHWEFIDAFPMTATGKIQKFVLREQLATRHADQ